MVLTTEARPAMGARRRVLTLLAVVIAIAVRS